MTPEIRAEIEKAYRYPSAFGQTCRTVQHNNPIHNMPLVGHSGNPFTKVLSQYTMRPGIPQERHTNQQQGEGWSRVIPHANRSLEYKFIWVCAPGSNRF